MPGLGGHVEPVVVAPIHVLHGSCCELGRRQIVERRERDGYVVAADLRDVAVRVDPDAAVVAEDMMVIASLAEAIFTGVLLAGKETERVGLDPHRPGTHFPTIATVALAGALREVEIGFESEFSAMTASVIGFLRHHDPMPRERALANLAKARGLRKVHGTEPGDRVAVSHGNHMPPGRPGLIPRAPHTKSLRD